MPPSPRTRAVKVKRPAPPSPSFDALPDEVLHHVLSFLPAQEAVRTCVLARRWRHLWKSATGLHILCGNGHEAASVSELKEFVYHLLLLRGHAPLDTCVLNLCGYKRKDISHMKLWIQHVLMCKVQVLSLDIKRIEPWIPWFDFGSLPLVSQNLKTLKLGCIQLSDKFLDFSSCPALEVLEFDDFQFLECHRISSQSVKFLSFRGLFDHGRISRTHIYAPNLISLSLEASYGWIPLLERMPSLVEATVTIKFSDHSYCLNRNCGKECCSCYPQHGDTVDTLVVQGVSEAQSLVLWSDTGLSIFRRELKYCPIFSNLKTLSLNEYWCMPEEFSSLTCILEHSPVLEKLTLQLFCKEPKSKVQMRGSPDTTERSNAISKHLKIVEVKCEVVDEKVLRVLEFLSKLSICKL